MGREKQGTGRPGRMPREGPKAPAREAGGGDDPEPGAAPRVAGYVRVSQERNLERFGMDAQIADVMRYVKYRRWQDPEIYRENGVSGYKRDRPALERLLADARAGKLDVVVFPSIDRAARSVTDMIDIDAELREANVTVVFVREGVNTSTPMGQFFRNVCASVAQFEGRLIYERLSKGNRRKAEQGGYVGGWLPYGYRNERHCAVVVPERVAAVRLVFRMRLEGKSLREIAGELNRQCKTQRGGKWRHNTVHRMLQCPFYAGWSKCRDEYVQGLHESIISVETFNRAQQQLSDGSDRKRNSASRIRLPKAGSAKRTVPVPKGGRA